MSEPAPLDRPPSRLWLRLVVDYAGPAAFLLAYVIASRLGDRTSALLVATGWLVAGSAISLALGFLLERRVALVHLLAGGFALVFGGLTLLTHDTTLVKIKPTAINLAFAGGLAFGLWKKVNPLQMVLGDALKLSDAAWRQLTLRYIGFFIFCAVLNEIVWRTQAEAVWVVFRMPGLLILGALFSFSQVPLMMKGAKAWEIAQRTIETQE